MQMRAPPASKSLATTAVGSYIHSGKLQLQLHAFFIHRTCMQEHCDM